MSARDGLRKRAGRALLLVFGGLLVLSAVKITGNHRAFSVTDIAFASKDPGKGWEKPAYDGRGFIPVEHPFWRDAGRLRIGFETSEHSLELSMYAMDCLKTVYLDGRRVMKRKKECTECLPWHRDPEKRCEAKQVKLDVGKPGRHLLAVVTTDIEGRDIDYNRDQKLLFLHYRNDAFGYRVLALACVAAIAWLLVSLRKTRNLLALPAQHVRALWRHRTLVLILVLPLIAKVVIAPSFLTTDVSESALIYTENLVNRKDLHFARFDNAYQSAAKYSGESHMHKPPGVYYQYAIPRLLFGFNEIYYLLLTRLPSMLGDLLIAWVLWAVVRTRRGEWEALLAAATYALSTGVFFTTGYVGRIDSLPIAFLMLALLQIQGGSVGNWRFALLLGTSVAWKHLAILVMPLLVTSRARLKWMVLAGAVTFVLCAPYLLDDPKLFLERLIMPQLDKGMRGVTWMKGLPDFGVNDGARIAKLVTLAYMAMLCVLPFVSRVGVWIAGALTFGLFVVAGKQVYEHYLLWSIPFMLLVAFLERSVLAFSAFAIGTLTMVLSNEEDILVEGVVGHRWGALLAIVYFSACVLLLVKNVAYADSPLGRLWMRLAQRGEPQVVASNTSASPASEGKPTLDAPS